MGGGRGKIGFVFNMGETYGGAGVRRGSRRGLGRELRRLSDEGYGQE